MHGPKRPPLTDSQIARLALFVLLGAPDDGEDDRPRSREELRRDALRLAGEIRRGG